MCGRSDGRERGASILCILPPHMLDAIANNSAAAQRASALASSSTASRTRDHRTLSRLVEAGAVNGAHIVGQTGGWTVLVRCGKTERALAAQRSRQVRLSRKFETLGELMGSEL